MASSKVPSSGGQYYYVSACASPPVSKPLSYLVGWLGVIGWQAYGTAICYGAATMGQGLYAFNHPDYVAEPWHGWLGTLAVLALAILVNISGTTKLPFLEGIMTLIRVINIIAMLLLLW